MKKWWVILFGLGLAGAAFAGNYRVMQWNLHIGIDMNGRYNLRRQAEVILEQSPDVVALNEVDKNCERTNYQDQTRNLAVLCGMYSQFGGCRAIPPEGLFGNAILARYPIQLIGSWRIPHTIEEMRGCTICRILAPEPFYVAVTHLSFQQNPETEEIRLAALKRIFELVEKYASDAPVILIGDLNSNYGSAPINLLEKDWQLAGHNKTWPADNPARELDYFATRKSDAAKIKVLSTKVIDEKIASDHCPVVTEVEIVK